MHNDLAILKTSMRFSAPYNHAPDWVERILQPFAPAIAEVYLPIHVLITHTARPWHGPLSPTSYDQQVDGLAQALQPFGIPLNFVANGPCSPPAEQVALENEILRLEERYPGSLFTIADLETAARVHRKRASVNLQSSTLSRVNGPTAAWYWKELVGSKGVTLDRSINRRPDLIKAIRRMKLTIRMVVNDDCIPECPSVLNHVTDLRLADELGMSRPNVESLMECVRCRPMIDGFKRKNYWLIAQKEILPFHLQRLNGLVDQVKITGRFASTHTIEDTLTRYGNMQADHNTFYREPPEAWDRISQCDRVCELCRWCEHHLEKRIPR